MYYGVILMLWLCSLFLSSSAYITLSSGTASGHSLPYSRTHNHASKYPHSYASFNSSTNTSSTWTSSNSSTSTSSTWMSFNSSTNTSSTWISSNPSPSTSSTWISLVSTSSSYSSISSFLSSVSPLPASSSTFPTLTTVSPSTSFLSTVTTTRPITTSGNGGGPGGPGRTVHSTYSASHGITVFPFLGDFVQAGEGGAFALINGFTDVLAIAAGVLAEMAVDENGDPKEDPVTTEQLTSAIPTYSSSIISSSSSSSSSTSSTATSTPIPYVVRSKKGASSDEVDAITAQLIQVAQKNTVEALKGSNFVSIWVANLTEVGAGTIASNPAVSAVFEDDLIPIIQPPPLNETRSGWARRNAPESFSGGSNGNESLVDTRLLKRADGYVNQKYAVRDLTLLSLPERVPLAQDDGFDYPEEGGTGVTVYIIDTGVNTDNSEWKGGGSLRGERREILTAGETVMNDPFGHGTCVMSKVAGQLYGTAKRANVVMVKLAAYHSPADWKWTPQDDMDVTFRMSAILRALALVTADIRDKGLRGSVLNMAFAWRPNLQRGGSDKLRDQKESYSLLLDELIEMDTVIVTASGNGRDERDSVDSYPARFGYGSSSIPIIIVGAVDLYGSRASYSQGLKELSASAPGNVLCGDFRSDGSTYDYGTSFASAAVAGIAATLLSQTTKYPELHYRMQTAYRVRNLIETLAYKRKGYARDPVPEDELPTVAWNGVDNYPQNLRARQIGQIPRGDSSNVKVYEPGTSGEQRTSDMELFRGYSWNLCLFSDSTDLGFSVSVLSTEPYSYLIRTDCFDGDYQMNFIFANGTETAFNLKGNQKGSVMKVNSNDNTSPLSGYFITGTQY